MAQHRSEFLIGRSAAREPRRRADRGRIDPFAARRGPARAGAGAAQRGRREPREGQGRGVETVGSLPHAGLPQNIAGEPCRAGNDHFWLPDRPFGADSVRLDRFAGGLCRPYRRRHRYAVEPHRPHPHLDLRGQSSRLGRRPRPLGSGDAAGRRQTLGCSSRALDAALRRSQDERADAAPKGKHNA